MNDTKSSSTADTSVFRQAVISFCRLSSLAIIVVSALTLFARYFWISDLLANLRIQQVIAGVAVLGICLAAHQWRLAIFALACVCLHCLTIVPNCWPVNGASEADGNVLRAMTVNVLTSNTRHNEIIAHILEVDPDVVAVIEMSASLGQMLDAEVSDRYPFSVSRGRDQGNFGIGLYSKHPLSDVEVFQLNENINSIEANCSGLRIIATHPLPPMNRTLFESRNTHLSSLADRIQSGPSHEELPRVVMGDFNVTPWSPHFQIFEDESKLKRARRSFALTPTWYARASWFPFGLVLDHVFVSSELQCVGYSVGPSIGSDHRSVTVEVLNAAAL